MLESRDIPVSNGMRSSLWRVMTGNADRESFFPAIEKKYGKPMAFWFEQMATVADRRYPEQIAFLRENHGFSQAHANALVMYSRGSTSSRRWNTLDDYLDHLDEVKAQTIRLIFDFLGRNFPDLELVIAWNHPMLKQGKNYVFGVSAMQNHLMMAPMVDGVLDEFRPRLAEYHVNKKTIRIPVNWDLDTELLTDMVRACLSEIASDRE